MRGVLLASVLLVALALFARPGSAPDAEAQTTELLAGVVDAGFEGAGTGWVPRPAAGLFLDAAGPVHGGARAGRVEASAAGDAGINTQHWLIPTGAHAAHTLRLWVSDDDPRTSALQVTLEFLGNDLQVRNSWREVLGDTTSGWQLVTVVASGAAGTAYVRIDVRASASAAGARFYVDDVTLEREPLPTATPTSTAAPPPTPTATATPTSSATPTSTAAASPPATPVATASPPAVTKVFDTLTNGGFEDGLFGWSDVGADVEAAGGAARVTSRSTSTKYLYQTLRVAPGGWYEASAYLVPGASVDAAWVRVAWYASGDGGGSQLATVDSDVLGAGGAGEVGTGPVQAPADARTAQVRIMLRPLSAAEVSLTIDNVRFEVTSPPPAPAPTPAAHPTAAPQSAGAASAPAPASTAATPLPASDGAPAPRLVAGRPVEDAGPAPSSTGSRTSGGSSGSTRASPGAATSSGAGGPASTGAPRLEGFAPEILLRITELVPDPLEPGNDGDFEWVEVSNIGGEPVALAGLTLRDNAGVVALPDLVLPPGASLVIAAPRAAVPDAVAWRAAGALSNGLGNSGDRLALLAADGRIIDALSYGSDTTYDSPPLLPPGPGRSLKRYFGDDGTFAGSEVSDAPSPGRFEPPPSRPTGAEDATEGTSVVASEAGDGGTGAVWYVLGGLAALGLAGAAGQRVWALRHRERPGADPRRTLEA